MVEVEGSALWRSKNILASVSSKKIISGKNGARRQHGELICVIEALG